MKWAKFALLLIWALLLSVLGLIVMPSLLFVYLVVRLADGQTGTGQSIGAMRNISAGLSKTWMAVGVTLRQARGEAAVVARPSSGSGL